MANALSRGFVFTSLIIFLTLGLALNLTEVSARASADDSSSISFSTENLRLLVEFFQNEFSISGRSGCVDPKPLERFFQTYLTDESDIAPEVESLCFLKKNDHSFELAWVLGPTPRAKALARAKLPLRVEDVWRLYIRADIEGVRHFLEYVTLQTEGGISFDFEPGIARVRFHHIGVQLKKLGNKPHSLLNLGISGLELNDNGDYRVKLNEPILDLPIFAYGGYKPSWSLSRVSILGYPLIKR